MATVQGFEVSQMKEAFSLFGEQWMMFVRDSCTHFNVTATLIIAKCLLSGESYCPKMVVVVVQKRISTRIFQRGTSRGLGNPPPGTVVDHTFTRKGW